MKLQKLIVFVLVLFLLPLQFAKAQSVRPPDNAVNQSVENEGATSNTLGSNSQSDYWRNLRDGVRGKVSIPDSNAGVMVQSQGWRWMLFRNGPMLTNSAWAFGILLAIILLFFLYRGRIRVEGGYSGKKVLRFSRFCAIWSLGECDLHLLHWRSPVLICCLAEPFCCRLSGRKFSPVSRQLASLFTIGDRLCSYLARCGFLWHLWRKIFPARMMWAGCSKAAACSRKACNRPPDFLILARS